MTDHTRAVYQRADGKWAWRITAANGQIVATDGNQGFSRRIDAQRSLAAVVNVGSGAEDAPEPSKRSGE